MEYVMTTDAPITILLADDHALVRSGVRAYLDTQPDLQVVAEAGNGAEAVRMAAEFAPDVALMDLIMPQTDGIEATRRLRGVSPRTQVIVLTSFHDDAHIFPAIKAGALSYLLKDINPRELADAVRKASRGESVLHPRVATRLVRDIQAEREQPSNLFAELSDREFEVLRLIAAGKSNAQIANELVLSDKTVKGYVSNLLEKLRLADRTQAAVMAWREGLVRRQE
jgi:two-component system, NarL family, response regulator LiaR